MDDVSNIIWTATIAAILLIWSILTLVNYYEGNEKKKKKAPALIVKKVSTKKVNVAKKNMTTKKAKTNSK